MDNTSKFTKWLIPAGILFLLLGIVWIYAPDIPLFKKKRSAKNTPDTEQKQAPKTVTDGREVREYILGATHVTYHEKPCLALLKTYEYEYGGIVRNDFGITYVDSETGKEIDRKAVELPFNVSKHSFFQAKEHFIFFLPTRLSQKESFLMLNARDASCCQGRDCPGLKSIDSSAVYIMGLNNERFSLREGNGRSWNITHDSVRFTVSKQELPKKGKYRWKEKSWIGEENAQRLIETTYESETNGFVTMTNGIEDKVLVDKYLKYPYTLRETRDDLYFVYEDNQKKDARVMLGMYSLSKQKVEWILWLLDIPEWMKFTKQGEKFTQYNYKSMYKSLHLIEFDKSVVMFTKNFWISGTDKSNGETLWSYDLHKTDTIQ